MTGWAELEFPTFEKADEFIEVLNELYAAVDDEKEDEIILELAIKLARI